MLRLRVKALNAMLSLRTPLNILAFITMKALFFSKGNRRQCNIFCVVPHVYGDIRVAKQAAQARS
jgi:tRNA pseudouridine-54 N-methylase